MQYKAIVCDVDGTFVINKQDALPSARVIDAVAAAQAKGIFVCLATGRSPRMLKEIIQVAGLKDPCVVCGGAQVINPVSDAVIWEQSMNLNDYERVVEVAKDLNLIKYLLHGNGKEGGHVSIPMTDIIQMDAMGLTPQEAEMFITAVSHISTIAVHEVPSWQAGKVDVLISHTLATKQHGVFELAKLLNLSTDEMIGIGDGGNDFPLLMACGLKVAMGNAGFALQEIADYVAPTVYEDGVEDVIEKYILNAVE